MSDSLEDRQLDANLRLVGRSLDLPALPGARRQESWWSETRRPTAAVPPTDRRGVLRIIRYLTAGSAVAASVAIALFLWGSSRQTVVEAGTILRSFHQTFADGFRLTLTDVGAGGVRVSGNFSVRFNSREGDSASGRTEAMGFNLAVRSDDQADPDLQNLDLLVAGAFSTQRQWVYLRAERLPRKIPGMDAFSAALIPMLRSGILLRLDGLSEMLERPLAELFGRLDDARTRLQIAGTPTAPSPSADVLNVPDLLEDVLHGRAGPERLEQLILLVEQAARQAVVSRVSKDVYRLTASDFTAQSNANHPDYELLRRLVLNITYRRGAGVESAELLHAGAYGGTITFGPLNLQEDTSLHDANRYADGGTLKLDLAKMRPALEGFVQPTQSEPRP